MFRRLRVLAALLSAVITLPLLVGGPVSEAGAKERCDDLADFGRTNFPNPTRIDNPFFSLVPGTQYTLQGQSNVSGQPLPHTVTFTVTDLIKRIGDTQTIVVHDIDVSNGTPIEAELAFFAQDDRKNVWALGEFPLELPDRVAPSTWIHGLRGAKAGVLVPGSPSVSPDFFLQAFAPAHVIFDCGRVIQVDSDALVIDEFSPDDPAAHQLKYYRRGLGLDRIAPLNDPQGETLVTVSRSRLNRHQLAEIRERTLELERIAYGISDVYRQTPPMQQGPS
ncbi:MAG: hypothetical protein HW416_2386 [Chloroflexi bacterium]|nr:hypothetical protein [Chloroflexota bacterium]